MQIRIRTIGSGVQPALLVSAILLALPLALPLAGCDDEPSIPFVPPIDRPPRDIMATIELVYDDLVRPAAERRDIYRDLFPPEDHPTLDGFIFRLQPEDALHVGRESWGLDEEIGSHESMFAAQDAREIFSLTLDITHGPVAPLDSPRPGQEDWREIFVSSVDLRLLFAPDDGLAVEGGQARFRFAHDDQRWYLMEWIDLPSPPRPGLLVGPTTWGSVKALYR